MAVACDMNSDFQKAFQEKCPHITIVFDHFHLIKNFNAVIDNIRKDEQKRLVIQINTATGKDERKRRDWEKLLIELNKKISEADAMIDEMGEDSKEHYVRLIDWAPLSKKFNKTLCIQNIRYLLRKRDVRLGDIEKASGNSPGYLSRLEKPDNTTDLGIEFLMNAADMLGVSVDDLVRGQLIQRTPNEEMLLSFIEKLINNTRNDTLFWSVETMEFHSQCKKLDVSETQPHALYDLKHEMDSETEEMTPVGWHYCSLFSFFNTVVVCGTSFHSEINDNGDIIYIMKCKDENGETTSKEPFYEMYHMESSGEINPLYCTRHSEKMISSRIENLYRQIQESMDHVKLSDSTKNMMLEYL